MNTRDVPPSLTMCFRTYAVTPGGVAGHITCCYSGDWQAETALCISAHEHLHALRHTIQSFIHLLIAYRAGSRRTGSDGILASLDLLREKFTYLDLVPESQHI